jgi:hypothetical protein
MARAPARMPANTPRVCMVCGALQVGRWRVGTISITCSGWNPPSVSSFAVARSHVATISRMKDSSRPRSIPVSISVFSAMQVQGVGSSSSSTRGRTIGAMATASVCCCPPPGAVELPLPVRPTSRRTSPDAARARSLPPLDHPAHSPPATEERPRAAFARVETLRVSAVRT